MVNSIQEQSNTYTTNQPENESASTAAGVSVTSIDEKGENQKSRKPRVKGLLQKLKEQVCWCIIIAHLSFVIFLQVEFYFGDSNLFKDRFLKQKIAEHPDGCKCYPM